MAKEQKKEQDAPPVPEVPEVAGPPKSYRLYILLGFVSLILFQMTTLFLLLPAKQEPPRTGIDVVNGTINYGDGSNQPRDVIKSEDMETILIGDNNTFKFSETTDDGIESFSLVLHVSVRTADKRKFDTRYEKCSIRVIDRVSSELRASTTDERKEASLAAIRERVKRRINDVLGTPWVQEVFFVQVNHSVS